MQTIKIGNKEIGAGKPVYIIAEAGVNHNGSLELARKLVDAAAASGADAVKFQTFRAKNLVTKSAEMADYQATNLGKRSSQLEMLEKLELKFEWHSELQSYAREKGLDFMSTPFDLESIDFLDNMGLPVFKAGSGDLTNLPYLTYMASKGKPLIISTGMAVMKEVEDALAAIYQTGNKNLVVLHCTTNYPCPLEEVNLRAMETMRTHLNVTVGYSDHTLGIRVPVLAVAMGATVIEKHLTLDTTMEGPDHRASLEPEPFRMMVEEIRQTEMILGDGVKIPNPSEERIKAAARKSLIAAVDIRKGTKIEAEMLGIKRPGTGLSPKHLEDFIGKIARHNISAESLLKWEDVE